MDRFLIKYKYLIFSFLTLLLSQSCKTDEFKFYEITIKEDWEIDVISPLFLGKNMEFNDFIYDWYHPVPISTEPITVLQYSNGTYKTIPTSLIFDNSAIIDSFPFYIQGGYILTEIELVFTITNGCPFPLNLQMQFFKKEDRNNLGPEIHAGPFKEANFSIFPVMPATSTVRITLDSLQLQSFNQSDRIKFASWFEPTDLINQFDTITAHYPVDVSIVLVGVVHGKNEE